jgi:hypothetical protein
VRAPPNRSAATLPAPEVPLTSGQPALLDIWPALFKPCCQSADSDPVADLGAMCAGCGAPTAGAYRCKACTAAAEAETRDAQTFCVSPPSNSEGAFRPSPWFFPVWAATSAWSRANEAGLLPLWLRRTVYVVIIGLVILSAVLAANSYS